jgi:hypothetical protein
MMRRLTRALLLPAAIVLLAAGCSKSSVGTVKGKVLYNGEPLSGADLRFKPESDLSQGEFGGPTNADGTFEIKIGKGTGQNAKPGRYVVLITKGATMGMPPADATMSEEERVKALMDMGPGRPAGGASGTASSIGILPEKYARTSSTPFKVDISEGMNDLNPFVLEGPPLKKK